ncbi:hypothetical protein KXE51_003555 [Salmonella enterica]|nr:hypothetical protein [Salmonella enterica]
MANKPTQPIFPLGLETAEQSKLAGVLNTGVIEHGPDAVMTVPEGDAVDGLPSAVRYNATSDEFEGYYENGGWLPLGGGGIRWEVLPHASTATLAEGRGYLIDNSSGVSKVVLPSPMRIGGSISICDAFGKFSVYPLTIDPAGHKMYGSTEPMTLSTDSVAATFTWSGEERGWIITAGVGLGQGRVYSRNIYTATLSAPTSQITLTTQPSVVDVYVNGGRLPESKYSLSGYTVNFSPSIASGSELQIIQYTPIQLGVFDNTRVIAFEALRRTYAEAGFNLVVGSFEKGGLVSTANDVLLYEAEGKAYSWGGTLDKSIPPGSTPSSAGGIGAGKWVVSDNSSLRQDLISETNGKGDALLRVKFPATGAIPRTQHDKNIEIVNVKDFGAVGDGITDDSPAFQAAINYIRLYDVGGGGYPNRVFGRKLYIPSGTYELKSKIITSLGYTQSLVIEGDSEITTMLSINNPDGFLDITCTSRSATVEINSISLLAKFGTASTQPGVGRDDLPVTLDDVHDISSGVGIKITYPEGISTVKSKSLKMHDVIMTGWNRTRGDYFSEGIYLTGGRNPTLVRVVIEGKYGYLLTGRPDNMFSAGTGFKMIDSYSPTLEDCYCNHYVRGFDLTSRSADPSYSSSEGGQLIRSTFDAMYGIRVVMPGGEPHFNIIACHLNYTRAGIDLSGKNQVNIKDCLFYCEASVAGTVARDIILRGAQKSQITGNIFAKTNTGDRYCISLYRQTVTNVPNTSLVINNNLYWAGATGTFRVYSLAGGGSASNVTIGDGECYENDMANLFTLGGSDHAAINPMRISSATAPEGVVWAPLGSLCVVKSTGAMYKKGGTLGLSTGWALIP